MSMSKQRRSRRQPVSTTNPEHQWVATEITIKLAVNGVLSVVALFSLFQLIPYQWS